jgi:rhodanese-related sulfurtransferase
MILATLVRMSATDEGSAIEVDPERVAEWLAEDRAVQVIDVREPHEREAGHIDGTLHIQLVELSSAAASVERERPVVFYCRLGSRSEMAAQAFRASGFEAFSMRGGLVRWAKEGRPLAPEGGYVADH